MSQSHAYKGVRAGQKRNWTSEPSTEITVSTKRAKQSSGKKMPTLNQLVRKAVVKLAETKSHQFTTNSLMLAYNATSWATVGLRAITPHSSGVNIVQGTGQGDRIGNKIRTKRVILDICMYPIIYNATTNPSPQPNEVIIWIFGVKESSALPTNLDGFFQNGNNSTDPSGQLNDTVKTVNTDKYILYKKVIKKLGFAEAAGSGVNVNYQSFANNDYKLNCNVRMDLTKYCPKNVVWTDTTAQPHSKMVCIAIEVCPSNGAAYPTNTTPAQMYYNLNYEFTDV